MLNVVTVRLGMPWVFAALEDVSNDDSSSATGSGIDRGTAAGPD